MCKTKLNRIGEKHFSNNGEEFEIIEYFSKTNITIKFIDGTIYYGKHYNNIKSGNIKNLNFPNIYNIGYTGIGKYSQNIHKKYYNVWHSMLRRCYDINYQLNKTTYIVCTVDKRWYNFQVFAEWCEKNYIEGFHLDKDILVKGNKVYSPDTCCFVPAEINTLFTKSDKKRGELSIGVYKCGNKFKSQLNKYNEKVHLGTFSTIEQAFNMYKINREFYIQQIANKNKTKIHDNVYNSMINYIVEITD